MADDWLLSQASPARAKKTGQPSFSCVESLRRRIRRQLSVVARVSLSQGNLAIDMKPDLICSCNPVNSIDTSAYLGALAPEHKVYKRLSGSRRLLDTNNVIQKAAS